MYASMIVFTFEIIEPLIKQSCFIGAVLILGANATSNQATKLRHTNAAASISDFCHYIYTMNPTGLPCDAVRVDPNSGNVDCDVFEYHMRPGNIHTLSIIFHS